MADKFNKVVAGKGPRGETIMGKVIDFDKKGRAKVLFKRGATEAGNATAWVTARKAKIVEERVPRRFLGRSKD